MAYNLPRRFSISIDGKPVAMPEGQVEERSQAFSVENGGGRPAIFEIQDDHLVSGDLVLGRSMVEPMIAAPKPVIWCHKENMRQLQPVQVENRGNGPEIRFRGEKLAYMSGLLCSPMFHDEEFNSQKVEVRPVPF
ncbi:uncharacterized protein FIESC28_10218 [Fusarium coffeatum]|uniref:Uncharacterized protein n=1 Tax=Fusarium coffeatum TaxID=231269 RepID=A0A366QWD8_9HYPO|nr:uncharacterized protein FIESC28_10218 [Fusarium coffeatum]RBR08528.1 hypothetical protein FIESC28_10218 [Fusarium coffeatum]